MIGVKLEAPSRIILSSPCRKGYGSGRLPKGRIPFSVEFDAVVIALCGFLHRRGEYEAMTGERIPNRMNALVKSLRPGYFLICDNPAADRVSSIREILQRKGLVIRFLTPYSPEPNTMEKAIAQLKSHVGKVDARTVDYQHVAVKEISNLATAAHARNHFESCG